MLLDGPALTDEEVRGHLAAALIVGQSCTEAVRMPQWSGDWLRGQPWRVVTFARDAWHRIVYVSIPKRR